MTMQLLSPGWQQLCEAHVDITAPKFGVEVQMTTNVLWVNVDGVCVLRVCRLPLPPKIEEI